MSAKRKQRVSDVAFAQEREMLKLKSEGLDTIAALLTKVDLMVGEILDAREALEAIGMSRMEIVRKLGAVNINRRILRMKREDWAAEVGGDLEDSADETPEVVERGSDHGQVRADSSHFE